MKEFRRLTAYRGFPAFVRERGVLSRPRRPPGRPLQCVPCALDVSVVLPPIQAGQERTGHKASLFGEGLYQAGSWEEKRRVCYKAEVMEQGTNRRFVVTTRSDAPKALYELLR